MASSIPEGTRLLNHSSSSGKSLLKSPGLTGMATLGGQSLESLLNVDPFVRSLNRMKLEAPK